MVTVVEVYFLPKNLRADTCVIIDVLRATTSIATALHNGARCVYPVDSVEAAFAMKRKYKDYILAGEEDGMKIEGFDMGNSPFEFSKDVVRGKNIILKTSNGTVATKKVNCNEVLAASFLNLGVIVDYLKGKSDVKIVCAGTLGKFSLEDCLLAGFIARNFKQGNDEAKLVAKYAENIDDIYEELVKSFHAIKLINLGFNDDVKFASKVDFTNTLPLMSGKSACFFDANR